MDRSTLELRLKTISDEHGADYEKLLRGILSEFENEHHIEISDYMFEKFYNILTNVYPICQMRDLTNSKIKKYRTEMALLFKKYLVTLQQIGVLQAVDQIAQAQAHSDFYNIHTSVHDFNTVYKKLSDRNIQFSTNAYLKLFANFKTYAHCLPLFEQLIDSLSKTGQINVHSINFLNDYLTRENSFYNCGHISSLINKGLLIFKPNLNHAELSTTLDHLSLTASTPEAPLILPVIPIIETPGTIIELSEFKDAIVRDTLVAFSTVSRTIGSAAELVECSAITRMPTQFVNRLFGFSPSILSIRESVSAAMTSCFEPNDSSSDEDDDPSLLPSVPSETRMP